MRAIFILFYFLLIFLKIGYGTEIFFTGRTLKGQRYDDVQRTGTVTRAARNKPWERRPQKPLLLLQR